MSGPPLEHQGRTRDAQSIARRELVVDAVAGAGFLVAAIALAVLGDGGPPWRWDVAIALVVAFAITVRARFDIGTGYAPPTQLVFVPILLLLPARYAPLIALAGWLLGRLPDLATRATHASRLLVVPGNCWFALGPALVLVLAGVDGPAWGDWPVYVLALVAQFAGDLISNVARDRVIYGTRPEIEAKVLAYVWSIDVALSPIGLLAALASTGHARFAFLAVLPLVALLVGLSTERTRRFEAEQANTRSREALIAGASHELQTPLAVLSGIADTLVGSPSLSESRRAESYKLLQRQTVRLRYLLAQFVDYARLKAGQELLVSARTTDLPSVLHGVAGAWEDLAVEIRVAAEPVAATADAARVHTIVMALVANALRYGPPGGPVTLACRADGPRAVIDVSDRGPGLAEDRFDEVFAEFDPRADREEGSGLGLFLARTGLRAQGGDIRLANLPEGGLRATVYLPLAP